MRNICVFLILLMSIFSVNAQDLNLEEIISKSKNASIEYTETFKDISAEELKTRHYYHFGGKLRDKKTIRSLFIVFSSPKTSAIDEFRSVLEYNGKDVIREEKDIAKFFEKVENALDSDKLRNELRKESTRFEKDSYFWGITLMQVNPFHDEFRPFFEYKVVGKEKIEGRDAFVIEYNQIKDSTHIQVNPSSKEMKEKKRVYRFTTYLPNRLHPTYPRMKGRIWVDAETGQLWKNDFKVFINPKAIKRSILVAENTYEYQSSEFGILVPKEFNFVTYEVVLTSNTEAMEYPLLGSKVEYSKFNQLRSKIEKYEVVR